MKEMRIIKKDKLAEFLDILGNDFEVIVPTIEKGDLAFGRMGSVKMETGFKGRPLISPKEYFFPQREKIFTFDAKDSKNVDIQEHTSISKRAIWGLRPCDLYGIKTLDTIFLSNYVDTYYKARRDNAVIMGLNCNEPCDTCFCDSWNTGPFAREAFDLLFTDLGDKYLVNVGSKKGEKVASKGSKLFGPATDADKAKAGDLEKKSKKAFTRSVRSADVKKKLPGSWDDKLWTEEALPCILCGGCNFVCPTCHCFNIEDIVEGDDVSIRIRYWDSCQLGGFTQMAAENTREHQSERLRQRIFHKCVYTADKYNGVPGCTGCGRCIEVCPAEIDITHILGRVTSK